MPWAVHAGILSFTYSVLLCHCFLCAKRNEIHLCNRQTLAALTGFAGERARVRRLALDADRSRTAHLLPHTQTHRIFMKIHTRLLGTDLRFLSAQKKLRFQKCVLFRVFFFHSLRSHWVGAFGRVRQTIFKFVQRLCYYQILFCCRSVFVYDTNGEFVPKKNSHTHTLAPPRSFQPKQTRTRHVWALQHAMRLRTSDYFTYFFSRFCFGHFALPRRCSPARIDRAINGMLPWSSSSELSMTTTWGASNEPMSIEDNKWFRDGIRNFFRVLLLPAADAQAESSHFFSFAVSKSMRRNVLFSPSVAANCLYSEDSRWNLILIVIIIVALCVLMNAHSHCTTNSAQSTLLCGFHPWIGQQISGIASEQFEIINK